MRLTREFYRPSPNSNARKEEIESVPGSEVYRYEVGDKPYGMVFGGRRSKPDFHFGFMSQEQREKKIQGWIDSQEGRAKLTKERRAKLSEPHGFEVGQLFYCSWGYDQTNINYYRLEELKGKCSGRIVPVCSKTVADKGGRGSTYVSPGENIRDWDVLLGIDESDGDKGKWKRLTKEGFSMGRGYSASPCEPDAEKYETAWGYGH